ncbi:MAG: winged helix-turn-helix domain-containing protein [Pseudomonadota bacterium]
MPTDSGPFRFEQFEVDVAGFELRASGAPISIEPQVFSLLVYLIEHRDRVVSKSELLDELWGHRFVSDAALSTQLRSLRKVLGDSGTEQRYLRTIRGRGYRFIGALKTEVTSRPSHPSTGNLGPQRTPLFGREDPLARCAGAIEQHRLVTVLGIGGTGKTAFARHLGRLAGAAYTDGVWFIDLVPITDPDGIHYALANALGLKLTADDPREQLIAQLRDRELLIILDNCEHLDPVIAEVLDGLLEFTRKPRFLATSREPLDLADEYRFYLDPLPVVGADLRPPAVQLFLSTAQRHAVNIQANELDAVQKICRQLDGLPLAIELAAAQLSYLSLAELGERLDRRFEMLTGRTRVGNRRQENLKKVLTDTWDLLEREERALLGTLAAFPGAFTMDDAEALLGQTGHRKITTTMARFVELCLITRTASATGWQMLETVRLFALKQLAPEARTANADLHAQWCLDQTGQDVHRHRHDFQLARWMRSHYDDVVAAQDHFCSSRNFAALSTVTSALALTIQLDEGARAREQLDRIERYLTLIATPQLASRLHAVAGVCAMILAAPDRLAFHAEAGLAAARRLEDPIEVAAQLILVSVRTSFVDPDLALQQLDEAVELARRHNAATIVDAANSFRAWRLAVTGQYEAARRYAREIADRKFQQGFDNLTFNAVCALIASSARDEPAEALRWTERIAASADANLLWSAQLLMACVYALHGHLETSEQLIRKIHERLGRAGWDGLPDLLVPLALLAQARGEEQQASAFFADVLDVAQPLQSFHVVAMYRQFRVKTDRRKQASHNRSAIAEKVSAYLAAS